MAKRIVYQKADGTGIAIVIPADPSADMSALAAQVVPDGIQYVLVDETEIPADRTFRDAWTHDGSFVVDMGKARKIHRDRIRAARAPLLAQLDTDFIRALERGDKKAQDEIAQKKQALRDAPADPRIDAASSPDELKAAIPPILEVP